MINHDLVSQKFDADLVQELVEINDGVRNCSKVINPTLKYCGTRDIPAEALVIISFMQRDFSAKLQQMIILLQRTAKPATLNFKLTF